MLKIEGLKQVGVFFGLLVRFVASRCDGREEESFPAWGTNIGHTDRLLNCFDQENWRRPKDSRIIAAFPAAL